MMNWMRRSERPAAPEPAPVLMTFNDIIDALMTVHDVADGEPVAFKDGGSSTLVDELIRLELLAATNVPGVFCFTPRGRAMVAAWQTTNALSASDVRPVRESRRGAVEMDREMLAFVYSHRAEHGCDPSVADMKKAFPGVPESTARRYRRHRGGSPAHLRVVSGR